MYSKWNEKLKLGCNTTVIKQQRKRIWSSKLLFNVITYYLFPRNMKLKENEKNGQQIDFIV